jgi:thiamine-monophosphate kinase
VKVSELGEFGLIDRLAEMADSLRDNRFPSWRNLIIGIGDDAAAWRCEGGTQLATVDSLVQGVHFPSAVDSWADLGWKSLAVNLSDIAAMGGLPRYALVALSLPGDTEADSVIEMYRGMLELAQPFGVAVVGGNISAAPQITITITVLGDSPAEDGLLTRDAARPGDRIAVTGSLGGAAAGLRLLETNPPLDPLSAGALRRAFWRPNPRVAEGRLLVGAGIKAAIDISDGLAADLGHICEASRVGARIDTSLVPLAAVALAAFGAAALEMAVTGGEDYELLFTGGDAAIRAVHQKAACPVTIIGDITSARGVLLQDGNGRTIEYQKRGWQHFAAA